MRMIGESEKLKVVVKIMRHEIDIFRSYSFYSIIIIKYYFFTIPLDIIPRILLRKYFIKFAYFNIYILKKYIYIYILKKEVQKIIKRRNDDLYFHCQSFN